MTSASPGIIFHFCSYGEFAPHGAVGPTRWPYHDLLTVHSGAIEVEIAGSNERVEAAQALLIYPNTPFHGVATESCHASIVHFELSVPDKPLPGLESLYGKQGTFDRLEHDQASLGDLARLIREPDDPARTLRRLALLMLILQRPLQESPLAAMAKSDQRLLPALEAIQQNLHQPPSIVSLAILCGMSPSYFRARFTQVVGVSPGQFQQSARLHLAGQLLCETQLPVKHIARQCGYQQIKHFYRAFTGRYEVTPVEYRKQHAPCA